MKIKIAVLFFLLAVSASAQVAYYPGFNDLFLSDDEPLFSPELDYFKKELKVISKTLYVGDVQAAPSSDHYGGFYSVKVVPTSISEYNFLNSGVFLKFNVDKKVKRGTFPATLHEFSDPDTKSQNGRIELEESGNPGVSLAFDPKLIKLSISKNTATAPEKAEFMIYKMEYKIDSANIEIQFEGHFTEDIVIQTNKIKKETISILTLNADKTKFAIFYIDPKTKKNKYIVQQKVN